MSTIIYTKANSTALEDGQNDLIETSVRLLMEKESETLSQAPGICELLFNVEDSQKYAETLVNHSEFGLFDVVNEGDGAASLDAKELSRRVVEHIQFMGEFGISANMLEDATNGLAADSRRLVQSFIRSYYRTRNKIAELALANGTSIRCKYGDTFIDTCSPDGMPVFCDVHPIGATEETQSNCYCKVRENGQDISAELIEQYLEQLSVAMRNMKDENGEVLGYEADTIVIPGNNYKLEAAVRKAVSSVNTCGTSLNDSNLQYGKWKIIVLPHWSTSLDAFILISSEANKALGGNMFFNRVPLTVKSWEDYHTGNRMWNGRCRFGVGFGSYKHMLYFCSAEHGTSMPGMTELA